MLKRIITGIVAICVLAPVLIFSNTLLFPLAIAVITVVCLYEIFKCVGVYQKLYITIPMYLYGAAAPFLMRYDPTGIPMGFAYISFIVGALYLVYLFSLIVWSHGKLKFGETVSQFAMSLYIIAALNSILYVRDYGENGKYIYLLIFIGAWVTDTFAYFVGYLFGKHKLIPKVSPKKTIEGSIGGILGSTVGCMVFAYLFNLDMPVMIIIGSVGSVIAQFGDLFASSIKRYVGIKDYGTLIPGHGGVLDRFDSVILVAPFVYYSIMLFSK